MWPPSLSHIFVVLSILAFWQSVADAGGDHPSLSGAQRGADERKVDEKTKSAVSRPQGLSGRSAAPGAGGKAVGRAGRSAAPSGGQGFGALEILAVLGVISLARDAATVGKAVWAARAARAEAAAVEEPEQKVGQTMWKTRRSTVQHYYRQCQHIKKTPDSSLETFEFCRDCDTEYEKRICAALSGGGHPKAS